MLLVALPISASAQPRITVQPVAQSVSLGALVNFSVTASSANQMFYELRLNDQPLASATNRTLSLTNVTLAVTGDYTVAISDAIGAVTSLVHPAPSLRLGRFRRRWLSRSLHDNSASALPK